MQNLGHVCQWLVLVHACCFSQETYIAVVPVYPMWMAIWNLNRFLGSFIGRHLWKGVFVNIQISWPQPLGLFIRMLIGFVLKTTLYPRTLEDWKRISNLFLTSFWRTKCTILSNWGFFNPLSISYFSFNFSFNSLSIFFSVGTSYFSPSISNYWNFHFLLLNKKNTVIYPH